MPHRSGSTPAEPRPDIRQASAQAARANCVFRPAPACTAGVDAGHGGELEPLHLGRDLRRERAGANSVVRLMPLSPASSRRQTDSTSCPIGVTQPIPVMTTRFMLFPNV